MKLRLLVKLVIFLPMLTLGTTLAPNTERFSEALLENTAIGTAST